jgi:hypothetical protein
MPKRSSRKQFVEAEQPATLPGEGEAVAAPETVPDAQQTTADGKNAAAVALGRLGGKKGGLARAAKLTKEQRSEIARKAAQARWANRRNQETE